MRQFTSLGRHFVQRTDVRIEQCDLNVGDDLNIAVVENVCMHVYIFIVEEAQVVKQGIV